MIVIDGLRNKLKHDYFPTLYQHALSTLLINNPLFNEKWISLENALTLKKCPYHVIHIVPKSFTRKII